MSNREMSFAEAAEWIVEEAANQVVIIGRIGVGARKWYKSPRAEIAIYSWGGGTSLCMREPIWRAWYKVSDSPDWCGQCRLSLAEVSQPTIEQDIRWIFDLRIGDVVKVSCFDLAMFGVGLTSSSHIADEYLVRIMEHLRMALQVAQENREWPKKIAAEKILSRLDALRQEGFKRARNLLRDPRAE